MRLSDFTEINPYEKLPKGTIAKKISMEQLEPYEKFVSGYSLEAYSGGAKFRNGDTIMARITPCLENGKTAFVSTLDKNEVGFGSTEYIVFRAKDGISHPDFVYYLVISSLVREPAIKSMVGSSGRQRVQQTVIDELEVPNYSLAEQQHIVDILGTLDEKIENNSKILNELNNLIQLEFEKTIFANSSEERLLADVFAFQEGPGIRNWQYVDKGINFINIRCINDGDIDTSSMNKISEQEAYGIYKHFLLNEWDLVMSMSGTLGRYAIVGKEHLPLCLNTSVIRFYPKNDFTYYSYMYAYLTSKDFIASITTLANGSAQQNVGPTHLKKVTIKLPNEEVIKQFHQRVFPLINRMVSLRGDNQKIKELKEYYLKKFFG